MWPTRIAIIAALVGCFGFVDSGYLTIEHLQGSYIRCGDDCSAVLGSKYAEGVAGVPLAAFGAMAYGKLIAAAVFAGVRVEARFDRLSLFWRRSWRSSAYGCFIFRRL